MNASIDRIEDGVAVLEFEDRTIISVSAEDLPPDASEGDVLRVLPDGGYAILKAETDDKRQQNLDLLNSLWE